ncbi:hypothetical protein L6R52_40910, partial [Myxococcota bacterium]|nr:hypothetical protein [Myxococcota bacterium]
PAAPKPPPPVDDDLDDDEVADRHELATGEIDLNALAAVAQNVSASDVVAGSGRVLVEDEEPATGAGELPRPPAGDPVTGELANPELYERLIADFKAAKAGKQKDEIMHRLEIDSLSEQTEVRYYAVEAMARLGRDIFGSQLLAATEDENEAVRALAVEALRR